MKIQLKKIGLWGTLIIGLFTLWIANLIYNKATDGFNARQIASTLSSDFFYETKGNIQSIKTIFENPLRYIGKGCQFYVFESEDNKYVVKFFKQKHLRTLHWLDFVPFSWIEKKIHERDERIHQLFSSCQIAYERLSDESGVVCVHLNRDPFIQRHITLIDKIGMPHPIYLDEFQFVVQKKAIPLNQILKNLDEESKIREQIEKICIALMERMRQGIEDKDPSVANNMAYIPSEDRLLFIDIGQFAAQGKKSGKEIYQELIARLNDISAWAHKHAPNICPYLQEKIKDLQLALGKDLEGINAF